ncbi:hypothetical protein CHLRE_16g659667v5 [Chlamydomonas reinhardtii]|uniref:Uncharacterized protein n=1 Tax=Chlamydomonas reinhardtii TaxID=3055 RepID=A0A2K3CTG1_CHLRE|nr:uncharacterized protein CHLRE_16g659667v5 [Chlamydomonas reinhardtii]PNW71570.1 hypothetical protein CHLRE_16g659667v5 [Chlamydomonas reinhardtii]
MRHARVPVDCLATEGGGQRAAQAASELAVAGQEPVTGPHPPPVLSRVTGWLEGYGQRAWGGRLLLRGTIWVDGRGVRAAVSVVASQLFLVGA